MVGVRHVCQQSHGEDPAGSLPHLPTTEPLLQLAVGPAQAQTGQHADDGVALQPETLNLQEVKNPYYNTVSSRLFFIGMRMLK